LKDINQTTAGFLKGKLQGFIQEISGLIHIRDEEEWESQFEKLVQTYGISYLAQEVIQVKDEVGRSLDKIFVYLGNSIHST